ncbi:MAG: hypothetical protein DI605_01205 [Sphingomonas sp.]|nr:MAG: hypothetical protein DI605_01205 [Sphingomonas sp.]
MRLANLRAAPRCLAKGRSGKPCQSPATKGKARCRLHGGAVGSGAPHGSRNGAFTNGAWTEEAIRQRRDADRILASARAQLAALRG